MYGLAGGPAICCWWRGKPDRVATVQCSLAHYVRFLAGGAICAALNNAILIMGDWLGYSYTVLIVIAYLVSVSIGYAYHCWITFDEPMTLGGYARFSASIWLGLPLSLVILAIFTDFLSLAMWITGPIMTCLMMIYHYIIARITIGRPARN